MRIGIIGPNKRPEKEITKQKIKEKLIEVAEIVANSNFEILLTPDKGSLLEFFGEKYLEFNGNKISILAPMKDDAEKYLNLKLGKIIDCDMWNQQPSKFNDECDLMICIGYGGIVIAEIGFSKYNNPKKIYILKELISNELPEEVNQSLSIEYIKIKELENILKNLKQK